MAYTAVEWGRIADQRLNADCDDPSHLGCFERESKWNCSPCTVKTIAAIARAARRNR